MAGLQTIIPDDVQRARRAWYEGTATPEQLELGSKMIPDIIRTAVSEGLVQHLSDGEILSLSSDASGMRYDLLEYRRKCRLRAEGIESE